jgi:hypothetical protein
MTRFTICSLTFSYCAALLALAPSALAVDGTVLINQATSVSGLPGCAHSGFPITICQSGSYKLSGNLTVADANTTAISITADNVTLDLNGFSILGPTVCVGRPVTSCSPTGSGNGVAGVIQRGITVVNGSVRGMGGEGINIGDASSVKNVHAASNGDNGISVSGGTVSGNTATGNGLNGIIAVGAVSGNYAVGNGAAGILVFCPSSAVGNTAFSNGTSNLVPSGVGCALANNAAP